jgi:nucleoside 2-deoxyribosyltransferase
MYKYDFYLAASLKDGKYDSRNKSIENSLSKAKKKVFRPIINKRLTPQEILDRNFQAIRDSSNFLFVGENPGEGVFIELGYAIAIKKSIYLYIINQKDYGKMYRGIVDSLPKNRVFNSLVELENQFNK